MAHPGRPARVEARQATAADVPAAVETLTRAFYGDPVWGWAFPDPESRLEQHRVVWRLVAEAAVSYGSAWLTGDCSAVALWIPPGRPELLPEDEARRPSMLAQLLGDGAARVLDTFERFDAAHPGELPHYYLSLLGTNLATSGLGFAVCGEFELAEDGPSVTQMWRDPA